MNAFITGSRAYGTPREDSDIDLVVACSTDEISTLWELCEHPHAKCVFGKLNLVLFNVEKPEDVERYQRWKGAHDRLVARAPVTKDEAIKEFRDAGAESVYLGEEFQASEGFDLSSFLNGDGIF